MFVDRGCIQPNTQGDRLQVQEQITNFVCEIKFWVSFRSPKTCQQYFNESPHPPRIPHFREIGAAVAVVKNKIKT